MNLKTQAETGLKQKVSKVLVTFGSSDPNNFTKRVLDLILYDCQKRSIEIVIVLGPGYKHRKKLYEHVKEKSNVKLYYSLGIMSEVMENCQCAISSNGRTVYELAHMHIPTLVLSHHKREDTHKYAIEKNGFIPIGIYDSNKKEKIIGEL